MTRQFALICAGFVMLQEIVYGQIDQDQEPTGSAATRQLTQADLDALETKIQRLDTAVQLLTEKIDGLAHSAINRNDDLEAVKPTPPQSAQPGASIEDRLAQLENDVAEQGNMLRSVTARAEGGGAYWRFDTNSQPARQEFDRALKSTVPPQADFVVFNRTAREECIFINGQRYTVAPGTQLALKVRPGTVTARLPHQQQPLALHVGFPNYYQSVDIKERPATQTYAQVVSEPVYWSAAY
jgi:uncharacterized coiled-coil protein SlyX